MFRPDSSYVLSYWILNNAINPEGTDILVPFWESSVTGLGDNTIFQFSQYLPAYLAGLWEGDGHVSFKRDKDNRIVGATLGITFHMKDLPLCKHLQKLLGGNIRLKTDENACALSFQNRESLLKIVKLLSGNLRSPKLVKFNILIDFLNNVLDLNLSPETADSTPLSLNSWLAGFIDADGSFSIDYSTNAKKFRIGVRLRIEQRMIDPYSGLSYETLFLQIAEFCWGNCNLKISTHNGEKKYYILAATSRGEQ